MKEDLFDWTLNMQPEPDLEAIEATLRAFLIQADKKHVEENVEHADTTGSPKLNCRFKANTDEYFDQNVEPNYPDLVPRTDSLVVTNVITQKKPLNVEKSPKNIEKVVTTTTNTLQEPIEGPLSETLFLLALLFGTCFLLYIFPPGS